MKEGDSNGQLMNEAVVDRACQNLLERKKLGLIRYNKNLLLSSFDGRSPITEAREEAEDLVIYLTWEESQRKKLTSYLMTLIQDIEDLLNTSIRRYPADADGSFACPYMQKLWQDLEQGKEIREGILNGEAADESRQCCQDTPRNGDGRTQEQVVPDQAGA